MFGVGERRDMYLLDEWMKKDLGMFGGCVTLFVVILCLRVIHFYTHPKASLAPYSTPSLNQTHWPP